MKFICKVCKKEIIDNPSADRKYCYEHRFHGDSHTHFYIKYRGIIGRCKYKCSMGYKRYGGRGIKCLWENYFDFKRDMYDSYIQHCKLHGKRKTTIERINNNGNYEKDNCTWATPKKQNLNTSKNRLITINNVTKPLMVWTRQYKIKYAVARNRLDLGWSPIEALENKIDVSFRRNVKK